MELSNLEMERVVEVLNPLLDRADMIGYVAARNVKAVKDALQPYMQTKDALVMKFGREVQDDHGNPTGVTMVAESDECYQEFLEEIIPIASDIQDVEIRKLKYEDVAGKLSGNEILALDFMLEE